MKNIMMKLKIMVAFLLCICMIPFVSGCDKSSDGMIDEDENYVYYIDKNYTNIIAKEYELKSDEVEEQVEELIEQLKLNTDDVTVTKAVPDGVSIENYVVGDRVVSISFDANYGSMDKAKEVLTRAAVVLTLVQLDEIDYVSFTVGGQPLANSNGEPMGNMNAFNFASNLDQNKEAVNKDKFTIYYANQKGDKLVKNELVSEYGSNMSKEQFIINKLIEGPVEEEGYIRTLPANVSVVRVVTMDNICYVTFGENFLTEQTNVPDELVIYSIVNSLSEISYIHKVQIIVNGKPEAKYHNKISLSEPFVRNLDYVQESGNQNNSKK